MGNVRRSPQCLRSTTRSSSKTIFCATIVCASNWRQLQSVILTLDVRAMPLCSVTVPVCQHYGRFLQLVSYGGNSSFLFACSNATGERSGYGCTGELLFVEVLVFVVRLGFWSLEQCPCFFTCIYCAHMILFL